ncbi:MAG: Flp pilus assembly complex ATPase component TadA [Deltaproteobacteria bacterium]|nr:Flp pilus assembly complex ATPase component TadA [Deltaproteobacteria bacterium]
MAKGRLQLGERLIQAGKITQEQLDIALKEQQRTGKLLGEILHRLGFVAEDELTVLLAADAGIQHIELNGYPVQPEALKLIPEATVRRLRAFPLSTDGRTVKVALANIFDVRAIDDLRRQTGRQVEVLSATEGDILRAIDHYYGQAAKGDALIERSIREAERGVPTRAGGQPTRAEGEAGEAGVISLVDQLLSDAVREGVTDIHVEPEETTVRVRYRVDGLLHNATTLPKAVQASVIARLKIMANINVAETRLPQDGRIRFNVGAKRIDLRVSTFPTIYGENVVLRLLDRERLILGLEKLGFGADTLGIFKRCLERPYGSSATSSRSRTPWSTSCP